MRFLTVLCFLQAHLVVGAAYDAALVKQRGYCLEDYGELRNLIYKQHSYAFPLVHGAWMSPAPVASALQILLMEKLNVNTTVNEGLEASSSADVLKVVTGCSSLAVCEAENGVEPPLGWAGVEVWSTSVLESALLEYVDDLGGIGYTTYPGLYMYDRVRERGEADGFVLSWWTNLRRTEARPYFSDLMVLDAEIRARAAEPLCNEGTAEFERLESSGFRCRRGWFVAPACEADNSTCIPVVLAVYDWNVLEFCLAAVEHDMPFAITWLGYVGALLNVVPGFLSSNFSFLFYWWGTDRTFGLPTFAAKPRLAWFEEGMNPPMLTVSQFQKPRSIVWKQLYKVDREVYDFWRRVSFSDKAINLILDAVEAGDSNYDAACRWLQNNSEDWESWLPDVSFCYTAGHFYNASQEMCQACPPGAVAPEFGLTECEKCSPGHYSSQPGRVVCQACPAGRFSSGWGASVCTSCQIGDYQPAENATSCMGCPAGLATKYPGSLAQWQCNCPSGFAKATDGSCQQCEEEGLLCPFAAAVDPCAGYQGDGMCEEVPFMVREGYFTPADDPLSVFQCKSEAHCPGLRGAGDCGAKRVGLTCGVCAAEHYETSTGECKRCGEGSAVLLPLFGLLGFVLCAVMHAMLNTPMGTMKRTSMSSTSLLAMAITLLLTFSIYGRLHVEYGHPLSTLFSVLSFVAFDPSIMRIPCITGSNSFLQTYVLKFLAVPCGFLVIVLAAMVMRAIPATRPYAHCNAAALLNSTGLLFSVFFIAVALMSVEAFQCVEHPNGRSSLVVERSILCWESGSHTAVVVIGCFAILLYPTAFLVVTGWITLNFRFYGDRLDGNFHVATRFLIGRMRPEANAFGFWYTLRNFLLTFCPVVAGGSFRVQIFLLMVVWVIWLIAQTLCKPWRFEELNIFDTFTTALQIMILTGLATLSAQLNNSTEGIGWVIIVVLSVAVASLLAAALQKFFERFRKKKKYSFFLTHHKAAAGLFVRRVKLLLEGYGYPNTFVDVDQLENLHKLPFIVRTDVDTLLVLLTDNTLRRFWCALEIVSAMMNSIRVIVVRLNDLHTPELTAEYIDSIAADWTEAEKREFHFFGVSVEDITKAYVKLATVPSFYLPMGANDDTLRAEVRAVIANAGGMLVPKVFFPEEGNTVHLIYDTRNPKQECVAQVLGVLFREQGWEPHLLTSTDLAAVGRPRVAVVLVSSGLVSNPVSLGFVAKAKSERTPLVTVISQEDFAKPEEAIRKIQSGSSPLLQDPIAEAAFWEAIAKVAPNAERESLGKELEELYKCLAWRFNPQESDSVMRAEFHRIITSVRHTAEGTESRRKSSKAIRYGATVSYVHELWSPRPSSNYLSAGNP